MSEEHMADLNIADYDLSPEENLDHDAACVEQAGKLMKIGYLEYEVAAYASAVYQNGEVYYYISAKEDAAKYFIEQCYLNGLYPTPLRYYYKRYDLLHQTEEEVKDSFRLAVARQMQSAYPRAYFEAIEDVTGLTVNDAALPILEELSSQLENCFDLSHLNIYENLLDMLLPSRLISTSGYHLAKRWLDKEYEKLSIEPVIAGDYQRTYAGFAYLKSDGTLGYFIDAFTYIAHEKQARFLSQGQVVTPILTLTYSAKSFQHMERMRENFKTDITRYLNNDYMRLMQLLKTLPASVNKAKYEDYLQIFQRADAAQAVESWRYYGYLWNVLQ